MQGDPGPRQCCPLSDEEIVYWAPKLGSPRSGDHNGEAAREDRLRNDVTYWFAQARSYYEVLRLPANWPYPPIRVDTALPEIAGRLDAIRGEISRLPGAVRADLRERFANFDAVMSAAAVLSEMLRQVAAGWRKPGPGQPSLGNEAEAVGILIHGVEQFTGEKFRSPRSIKQDAELQFVRLLTQRLLPELTDAQFRTALRHWYKQRRTSVV
jgi:hypothetical protein